LRKPATHLKSAPAVRPHAWETPTRKIEFEDNDVVRHLCGGHGEHLKFIEGRLGVSIGQRGAQLLLAGNAADVHLAERLLRELYEVARAGRPLSASDFEQGLKVLRHDPAASLREVFLDTIVLSSHNRPITPKSVSQKRYIEAIREKDMVFGIGPAGTGKTYLAMAMAVAALSERRVKRIVLTRPAVEAGEKLGFLPGDIAEKVNPYLRPLYDALHDMMDFDKAQSLVARGIIEVAPLAFMRGRTLNDSFVILDEAQNATIEQMKMFLTRLGFSSKAVVTGDITQVDLPNAKLSGLIAVRQFLNEIEGIEFCEFTDADVVRHPLVQEVIRAFEQYESRKSAQEPKSPAAV
jgi:phosphate starvation-inducible protein PhoH and related proteins